MDTKQAVEPIKVERMEAPAALATIDVTDQTTRGLELFEERVMVARKQLAIALKLTQPGQWVVMDGGEGKESVYATAGAADRILRMGFGMRWGEKKVVVQTDANGNKVAVAVAPLLKHDGTVYETFEGHRKMGGYVKNEQDLVKSALANLAHRAVTEILGLRFLTPADFKDLGLDLSKLPRRVEFEDHGTDEAPSAGGATVPWGKKKGESVTALDAGDLDYYEKKAREAIADESKAKWRGKEQKWLDAIMAEKERRAAPPPAATGDHAAEKAELTAKIKEAAAVAGITEAQITSDLASCKSMAMARALLAKVQAAAQAATKKPVEAQTA